MKKIRNSFSVLPTIAFFFSTGLCLLALFGPGPVLAAFGEDVEKPKPVFTRDGAAVDAKLLPRGKSTSVTVRFTTDGAALEDVQPVDFASVNAEGVDRKDFRCDLFSLVLGGLPAGGQASLSLRSDFFSSSTRFFVYNPLQSPAWNDVGAGHRELPDRVREMTFTVTDGGPLDADGLVDGRVLLTGGPHDSFWGYAVGTLFIRFFGVFLVLGVLMVGMMVAGKIFETADKRRAAKATASKTTSPAAVATPKPTVAAPAMAPEMAAAIALALHLEMSGPAGSENALGAEENQNAWGLYGRQKIMSDRMQVFKRHSHA